MKYHGQKEADMRKAEKVASWVVYKMTVSGRQPGPNAVCEQSEWDEMERQNPGRHTLIRAGMMSESEAERLARESSGGTAPKGVRLKSR
jgi:hypothetical protein